MLLFTNCYFGKLLFWNIKIMKGLRPLFGKIVRTKVALKARWVSQQNPIQNLILYGKSIISKKTQHT